MRVVWAMKVKERLDALAQDNWTCPCYTSYLTNTAESWSLAGTLPDG